ncbi:hypothetical protein RU639_012584 [Aspergillus parasiticus]
MPLILTETQEADAPRIAEIHMAAFHDNAMLLAQFPTSAIHAELFNTLVQKARDEVRDPQWTVLVVHDEPGFQPQQQGTAEDGSGVGQGPRPAVWPAGTRFDILEDWTRRVKSVTSRVVGTRPCYNLSYIATDPEHERHGAASMLVKWGIEQAKKDGVLVALESTKQGWPLELGRPGRKLLYEMCFVWRP